ncbi:MAG: carbon-nitrogen hydrolase, partial [Actinomycetota bacterium]|nr:carbon-nitrogen hydrolase [Actinomycetota bacterium]
MIALLAQLQSRPGAPEENARRAGELLREHRDADLAVFPELYLSGYDPPQARASALAREDGPLLALAEAAAESGTAVVVGFVERGSGGALHNSAACIAADGGLAAVYRKVHLFGGEERRVFTAGDVLLVVELAGRRVAPLICFDIEFPEPARAAARAGADLLVTASANMDPYGPDHELAARARALDNRLVHLYVNRVGTEAGRTFAGGTLAAAPDG